MIPNGVDIEYFQPRIRIGTSREGLIFAGAMDWYPNREAVRFFLKEIWPKLREEKLERTVTFLGRNPPRELLEAAKNPAIRAPGFVDDVRPYLDDAGIYICPIRDGGGTRLKILDALSMGKPLVATGMAVEGLDLVEEVHYLKADTATEFLAQINRLESDSNLCQAVATAGQLFVGALFLGRYRRSDCPCLSGVGPFEGNRHDRDAKDDNVIQISILKYMLGVWVI